MKAYALSAGTASYGSVFYDVWQRLYDAGPWDVLQYSKSAIFRDDLHLTSLGNLDKARVVCDVILPNGYFGPF